MQHNTYVHVCNSNTDQYPLEFITQDYASASAMSYGFQLLEDIRQIRMGCEERRDELERQFTLELQNWMKYSQQTQQLITKAEFGKNTPESKEMVQETLTSTYRELYSSRMRRLNVIERQCDEKLEELLQQRKISMMLLVAGLMNQNLDRLKDLVGELANYKTQLQNGLQNCIERQTARYESRISSKLLAPEDYCSGPDIDILTAFLNRMLPIIMEEQMNFFGDDEDLGLNTPCGSSGCEDIEETTDTTHHAFDTSTVPASNTMATQPNTQSTPSPPSHELPTRPTQPGSTQIPSTDTTRQPPTYDTTQPETTSTTTTGIPTDITAEMKPPSTEQNLPIIATQSTGTTPEMKLPVTEPESVQPEIKVPVTEPAMHTTTPEPYEEQTSTQPETKLPHTTAPVEDTTTLTTPGTCMYMYGHCQLCVMTFESKFYVCIYMYLHVNGVMWLLW